MAVEYWVLHWSDLNNLRNVQTLSTPSSCLMLLGWPAASCSINRRQVQLTGTRPLSSSTGQRQIIIGTIINEIHSSVPIPKLCGSAQGLVAEALSSIASASIESMNRQKHYWRNSFSASTRLTSTSAASLPHIVLIQVCCTSQVQIVIIYQVQVLQS